MNIKWTSELFVWVEYTNIRFALYGLSAVTLINRAMCVLPSGVLYAVKPEVSVLYILHILMYCND